jgi:hypothetical protein
MSVGSRCVYESEPEIHRNYARGTKLLLTLGIVNCVASSISFFVPLTMPKLSGP